MSFCFSKGLVAPVGSILVGPKDFIDYGRRLRKALGGGMRLVTHHDVDDEDVERAIAVFTKLLK